MSRTDPATPRHGRLIQKMSSPARLPRRAARFLAVSCAFWCALDRPRHLPDDDWTGFPASHAQFTAGLPDIGGRRSRDETKNLLVAEAQPYEILEGAHTLLQLALLLSTAIDIF